MLKAGKALLTVELRQRRMPQSRLPTASASLEVEVLRFAMPTVTTSPGNGNRDSVGESPVAVAQESQRRWQLRMPVPKERRCVPVLGGTRRVSR